MAVAFNGTTSKLTYSGSVPSGTPISVFGWVKLNATGMAQYNAIFGFGEDGATRLWRAVIEGQSDDKARLQINNGSGSDLTASTSAAAQDVWMPLMIVQLANGNTRIYFRTGAIGSNVGATAITWASINRFVIGAASHTNANHMAGEQSRVAIWTRELIQADFDALADPETIPSSVQSADLWEYWALSDADDLTGLNSRVLTPTSITTGGNEPDGTPSGVKTRELSGSFILDDFTFSGTIASAAASTLFGTLTLDNFVLSGTLGLLPGRVDTPPFKNWTGTLLPGTAVPNVVFLRLDRTTALSLASQVTAGDAVLTVENAALVSGTPYVLVTFNADGTVAGAQRVVAA